MKEDIEMKGQFMPVARLPLHLWTIDNIVLADSEGAGMPMRSFVEVYGPPESGKSSLAYYSAGSITQLGNIALADLEANANPEFIKRSLTTSGFKGVMELMDFVDNKGNLIAHEKILKALTSKLKEDKVGALILDSVAVVTPTAERESKGYGQARMGMRAQVMAQWSRDVLAWLRATPRPKVILAVNHSLQSLGGGGWVAPGGDTKNYIANVRLRMWRYETFDCGIFLAKVKAEKLKHGGTNKGRVGFVCIVPEWGVSKDLTAMFDCFELGLAERGKTVKIDGKSLGYLEKKLFKAALDGNSKVFEPFHEALAGSEMESMYATSDEEEEDELQD